MDIVGIGRCARSNPRDHHRHSLSRSSFSLKSCSRDSWLLLFSQSSTGTWASDFVDLVVLFFRRVLGEGLPATEAVGLDFFWKFIFDHPGRWVVILDSAFQSTSDHHRWYWSTFGQILLSSHFQPFLWAIVSFYVWRSACILIGRPFNS